MNQFRCKQVKSTLVLGFKTLATGFLTVIVQKAVSPERKRVFNYAHEEWSLDPARGVQDSAVEIRASQVVSNLRMLRALAM